LLSKLKPDFKTISDFRKDNKKALIAVFREFNRLCSDCDLFGKELVAVDGTKIRACNSKKNNFNNKKLDRQIKYIEEKISEYMAELEESDKAETHDRKPDIEEINQRIEELKKCVENGITPYVTKQTYSNGTGDKDFYASNFRYDEEEDKYICPAGNALTFYGYQRIDNQIAGRRYRNLNVCKDCRFKERCTKNVRGRTILRHKEQDFLDTIDLATQMNMDKHRRRQEIIEHTFGTIKRSWGAYYFLTKRIASISAEISISYLAYNLRRVVNILGVEEILKKIRDRINPVLS